MKRSVLFVLLLAVGVGCATDPNRKKSAYIESGKRYYAKGNYQVADIQFRNALQIAPQDVEANYQAGQTELILQNWQGAYKDLSKAEDLDPDRIDVRLALAQLWLAARDFDKCEKEASAVLAKDPQNVLAYKALGAALVSDHKYEQALDAFTKLAQLQPKDASSYTNLALALGSLNHPVEAEQSLKKAVALDAHSAVAIVDLARMYESQKSFAEVEQLLGQGVRDNPDSVPLYVVWAEVLAAQGKDADAEAALQKLRARLPKSVEAAMQIGDFYFQRQNLPGALAEYQRALSIAPKGGANNLEVQQKIADVYLNQQKIQQASDVVQQMLRQSPKDTGARVEQGRILIAQDKATDAVVLLQQVVNDAPDSAWPHYYLALAYSGEGAHAMAKGQLDEAFKYAPDQPEVLKGLTQVHLSLGNIEAAQEYAQRTVQLYPSDPSAHVLLGTVLVDEEQFAKARQEFSNAQSLAPKDPMICLDLAQTYIGERNWLGAEKEFQSALQVDPRYAPALAQLTDFLASRDRMPEAIALAQKYVSAYPDDANGHYVLGSLYVTGKDKDKAKDYDQAKAQLDRAVQINPNLVLAYLQLGRLYQERGDVDTAIRGYEKALVLRPHSTPLRIVLGNLYEAKGNFAEARRYFESVLAADPNSAVAANNLAWIYATQNGNLDVALGLAQKAKQLLPDYAPVSDTLAWIYYKKGVYAAAIPLLKDCVSKVPKYAGYRYHLGMALLAAGDKPTGDTELSAALKLGLTGEDGSEARKALGLGHM